MSKASDPKKVNGAFIYEGNPYIKVTPVKMLFNSTMVHEVVTRGDMFAVNLSTHALTILPGDADKTIDLFWPAPVNK